MKRLFSFFAMICMVFGVQAEEKSLFITFLNGNKAEFVMADKPAFMIADDKLKASSKGTIYEYKLWKVVRFTFGTPTGIQPLTTMEDIRMSGCRIIVPDGNVQVKVFSLDGSLAPVTPVCIDGQTVVSLEPLPQGVYIININGNSLKFIKP